MARELPPRVFEKSGSYYHVKAEGQRRVWTKLCRVKDGLPAMYRALADMEAIRGLEDTVPKLISDWLAEVSARRSSKTQANDAYMARTVSESFKAFRASDVSPPDVAEFLRYYQDMPRTHNAYRSFIRELMRFAEEKGFRLPGSNPVQALKTMSTPARTRYVTDSELRRIKVGAMYASDGQREKSINPSGRMICSLIDLAYLTGQRISDLLALEWSAVTQDGIHFKPTKTTKSTGAQVLIVWTPRLRDVIDRIKAMKRRSLRYVITTQTGQRYTYSGARAAWDRAIERSGVQDCRFHDLRAKALTDKDRREGMEAARTMGAHSTQNQTADYVRHRTAKRTGATK